MTESLVDQQQHFAESVAARLCICWKCIRARHEMPNRMIGCPVCGNKRCPRASDHALACTGSNEPGQPGSIYRAMLDDREVLDEQHAKTQHRAVKVRPVFAWYDIWVGVFWDQHRRKLYVLPLPCIGFVVEF